MAIERARADLARLQSDIKRLEAQLTAAREQAHKVAHYIEITELYDSGSTAARVTRRGTGGRAAAAAAAVIELLRERGHPIHTRQLVDELRERGIVYDTDNPVTNLSASLSRHEGLIGDRSKGWSLREWLDPHPGDESDSVVDVISDDDEAF